MLIKLAFGISINRFTDSKLHCMTASDLRTPRCCFFCEKFRLTSFTSQNLEIANAFENFIVEFIQTNRSRK